MTGDKHILVVEDEIDLRDAMVDALRDAGYQVTAAENGASGLEAALRDHPDLILLDLMMPVMDGQEVIKRLRADPWGQNAKIVVLSAMDDIANVALAHEGKLLDYFIKAHMSLDDIVKQVRLLLFTS